MNEDPNWIVIWNHDAGYAEAREQARGQSLDEDLQLIDMLYGRDELAYGATAEEVKAEALRQLERDWRTGRNEQAEFHANMIRLQGSNR